MSEEKHTEGPWEANLSTTHAGQRWSITAPTPKPPCRYTVAVAISHEREGDEATAADARLIAAAPDLFEHALWVVRLFGTDNTKGKVDLAEHIAGLRAAVAKALGK